jgi:hypothetical protein
MRHRTCWSYILRTNIFGVFELIPFRGRVTQTCMYATTAMPLSLPLSSHSSLLWYVALALRRRHNKPPYIFTCIETHFRPHTSKALIETEPPGGANSLSAGRACHEHHLPLRKEVLRFVCIVYIAFWIAITNIWKQVRFSGLSEPEVWCLPRREVRSTPILRMLLAASLVGTAVATAVVTNK